MERRNQRLVKNEKTIKNIDPEKGVTPEQLLNHLHQIFYTVPNAKYLSDDEKNFVINDTVIAIYKKMEEGKVNKFDYFEFRSYLFQSFVNNINQKNKNKLLVMNQIMSGVVEDETGEYITNMKTNDDVFNIIERKEKINKMLEYFKKIDTKYYEFAKYVIKNQNKRLFQLEKEFEEIYGEKVTFKQLIYRIKYKKTNTRKKA